jgi:hypothetical protein
LDAQRGGATVSKVVLRHSSNEAEVSDAVHAKIEEFALRGFRSLGISIADGGEDRCTFHTSPGNACGMVLHWTGVSGETVHARCRHVDTKCTYQKCTPCGRFAGHQSTWHALQPWCNARRVACLFNGMSKLLRCWHQTSPEKLVAGTLSSHHKKCRGSRMWPHRK